MAMRRPRRSYEDDPFTDLLFNALLGFTFLFLVAIIYLNPPAKSGIIDPKAEFIITVTWEDGSPDDIDTWVEGPNGELIWFKQPEQGLIHLDRDDRGQANDMLLVDGKEIINPLNQEVVTLRGVEPGEYVVNVHYYQSQTARPVAVTVRVARVNPQLEIVYYGTLTLPVRGAEKTAVRFTIVEDGRVENVNTLDKPLVTVQ